MVTQIKFFGEPTATVFTFKGSLPIMNVLLVLVKIGTLYKSYTAMTDEGPLASVRAQMVIEFTRTLDHSVAPVIEFALEQAKKTINA